MTNPRFVFGANSNRTAFTILVSKQQYLVINFVFWNRTQIKRQYCFLNIFFNTVILINSHTDEKKCEKEIQTLGHKTDLPLGYFTQSQ